MATWRLKFRVKGTDVLDASSFPPFSLLPAPCPLLASPIRAYAVPADLRAESGTLSCDCTWGPSVQRPCMADEGTESRGHYVTRPRFLSIQGQVLGCWCSLLSTDLRVLLLAWSLRTDREEPGTFSGQANVPGGHTWSHFILPQLGSCLATFASLQISPAEFRSGPQGSGQAPRCDRHQGGP